MALIDHQSLVRGGQNELMQNIVVNDSQVSVRVNDLSKPINDLKSAPRAPHLQLPGPIDF